MINTILIDDHTLVRSSLRHLLEQMEEINVIGETGEGHAGIELACRLSPNLVILDLILADIHGLEVAKHLIKADPHIKILVVSSIVNDLSLFRLLEAGAHGYLTKGATLEEFTDAISAIFSNQRVISPKLVQRLALSKISTQEGIFRELSKREMDIVILIIRGLSVKAMAQELSINYKTVHSYRNRIFEKLNINNNLSLALLAIQHGLIEPEL